MNILKIFKRKPKFPSDNEFLKMFMIVTDYDNIVMSKGEGWTWNGALTYLKEHWNDILYNENYIEYLDSEEEENERIKNLKNKKDDK